MRRTDEALRSRVASSTKYHTALYSKWAIPENTKHGFVRTIAVTFCKPVTLCVDTEPIFLCRAPPCGERFSTVAKTKITVDTGHLAPPLAAMCSFHAKTYLSHSGSLLSSALRGYLHTLTLPIVKGAAIWAVLPPIAPL